MPWRSASLPMRLPGKIESLITLKVPQGIADKMKLLPRLLDLVRIPPKTVTRAPCQEVVHTDPDLSIIPALNAGPRTLGNL